MRRPVSPRLPGSVRGAGWIVAFEGTVAIVVALTLVIRGVVGADQHVVNGFGTAAWFVVIGAGVLAGGVALLRGRPWGRGPAVFANLILLPVAWYLGVGSGRPGYGAIVAVMALAVLGLLFTPASTRWAAGRSGRSEVPRGSS